MIIGSGLLAKSFGQVDLPANTCIFASGVSNSAETDPAQFARERSLLESQLAINGNLVYFSSCTLANVSSLDSAYLAHKRQMEQLVLLASPGNKVFRLPQVVGKTENRFTLTNYLNDRICKNEPFTVWTQAERNLIDVDDVVGIVLYLLDRPTHDRLNNIAAEKSLKMPEIVKIFERVLGREAQYSSVAKGEPLQVPSQAAMLAADALNIDLGGNYAERTIRKYYAGA